MDSFPDFEPEIVDDSVIALCDKLREQKVYSDIADTLQAVADITSGDPMEGFSALKSHTARLVTMHTVDDSVDVRNKIDEIRDEYYAMKSGATGLKGKAYPWQTLNDATLGCQDGQVIVLYGRPKSKKTMLALCVLKHFHDHGSNIAIFSQELSTAEMARRYVALSAGINYSDFLRGRLDEDTERDFLQNLEAFAERPPVIISMLNSLGDEVALELSAQIDELECNAILIDGAQTLGRDWKELSMLTKAVKRIAKQKNVPILMTTHAHRRGKNTEVGGTADDIAHSDSFFQDCDLALRVVVDVENRRKHEAILWTAAIREGEPCAFAVNTYLFTNMEEKHSIQLSEDDTEDAEAAALDGEDDVREAE